MTQEEKAIAYDEALEKARKLRDDCQKELDKTDKNSRLADLLRSGISAIEMNFPQLRETDDERIRRKMIEHFKNKTKETWCNMPVKDIIAYLEKQEIFSKNGEGCYYYHADGSYTFIGSMGFGPIEDIKLNGERPKTENKGIDLPDSVKINGMGVMTESEIEDERIIKLIRSLLENVRNVQSNTSLYKQYDDALAWLEKQKPVSNPKWAELTWKDINELERIINNVHYEFQNGIGEDSFGELVLERFKEYKDDGSMDEQKPAESISQLTVQGKGVYKICPRCKERMVRDDSMVYTSMPPQYRYECPKCGESECDTVMYDNPEMEEQKPVKMEVYEIGKETTICGQDYKCKKDYKAGNCWYIKDVVYHCSRDGYLNDQNGVSWSCTPEWFNEYIYTDNELADKEKNDFVCGQFLQCKLSFDGFKEGEHYWLEYVGDDMYVGRSDNILNQKFHITPRQLFTLFSQELEEVQGPPQEEKQVSLNYEPLFNENPSDNEIIEALIKNLKEQDGFLTAIDCVSTKAILSWLEKHLNNNSLT